MRSDQNSNGRAESVACVSCCSDQANPNQHHCNHSCEKCFSGAWAVGRTENQGQVHYPAASLNFVEVPTEEMMRPQSVWRSLVEGEGPGWACQGFGGGDSRAFFPRDPP